jgi:hypothetical protein
MASKRNTASRLKVLIVLLFCAVVTTAFWKTETIAEQARAQAGPTPTPSATPVASQLPAETPAPAVAQTEGCLKCHNKIEPMHRYNARGEVFDELFEGKDAQGLSCTSCHGGNPAATTQELAHVEPRFPDEWNCRGGKCSSRNPERTNTLLAKESREFVRFINPGDFRVVRQSCGECHSDENQNASRSMMAHGAMLWGAALYNNGGFPIKDSRFGESYSENGNPQVLFQVPQPTAEQRASKGYLDILEPLPRWEISQPGNILRVFERGGRRRLEVGNPDREEEPGKPDKGLSPRGLGTNNRTDPVYLGLQKTRLLDPTLNFLGTNDHAGDYRSAGCTACHVIYANDTSVGASGPYAKAGNQGFSQSADTSIPKNQSGHPIKHQFTSQIPTQQCMTCHMHPGTNMVATYLGRTWWDNESDGKVMYPRDRQIEPSQADEVRKLDKNPEGSSLRGLWSDSIFLQNVGTVDFNKMLTRVQFADTHGHGWVYKNVYKKDRKGNLLDAEDNKIAPDDPNKWQKAVHLQDIHLERGMHCVDCHFRQDAHGTGILYNEPRAAVEIGCIDCHGTMRERANTITSGTGAMPVSDAEKARREQAKRPITGRDLTRLQFRGSDGRRRSVLEVINRDATRKDCKRQQRSIETRRHRSELDRRAGTLVESQADGRHRHAGQSGLQRKVGVRKNDAARRNHMGRRDGGERASRASGQQHHLLRVSHVVGDELLSAAISAWRRIARCRTVTTKAASRATSRRITSRSSATTSSCSDATAP